jgi:hypothetical protein
MTTQPYVLTPDELLEAGLIYAKEVINAHLAQGELVAFVIAFMRTSEEGDSTPIAIRLSQTGDTPAKRRQEVRDAGRFFVRGLRAGTQATHFDPQSGTVREAVLPEVDIQQPLLVMHVVEAWYLPPAPGQLPGQLPSKSPSKSPNRKEGILVTTVNQAGQQIARMATIRRTKRGKALPIQWDADEIDSVSDSHAMYFLLGMAEEIRSVAMN